MLSPHTSTRLGPATSQARTARAPAVRNTQPTPATLGLLRQATYQKEHEHANGDPPTFPG